MPTPFTVMTWNVENLFRFGAGGSAGPKSPAEYEAKRKSLAETIRRLAPDVVALQEVGGQGALDDLQQETGYPVAALAPNGGSRGIHVAFLSKLAFTQGPIELVRFPQAGLESVPGGGANPISTMGRGALHVTVEPVAGFPIHLITAHLKSKLLTFPGPRGGTRFDTDDEDERARVAAFALMRRTGEAVALRAYANTLTIGQTAGVILLGDMNDGPNAATSLVLVGPPDDRRHTHDKRDDARLYNLVDTIKKPERRFSRIFQGQGEMIDHIYASAELRYVGPPAVANGKVTFAGLPLREIVSDSHVDGLPGGPIPSISADPTERQGEPGSDHAPVTASFPL